MTTTTTNTAYSPYIITATTTITVITSKTYNYRLVAAITTTTITTYRQCQSEIKYPVVVVVVSLHAVIMLYKSSDNFIEVGLAQKHLSNNN